MIANTGADGGHSCIKYLGNLSEVKGQYCIVNN